MKRNIEKEMVLYTIQKPPKWEIFEKSMVDMYIRMFEKYFKEKTLIKKGNLVEIRYEDFILNPLNEIERTYSELDLNGFDKNKEIFNKYINSQSRIKTQKYEIDENIKNKIYNYLKFTIDKWGYNI
jgi:hypothetical protein